MAETEQHARSRPAPARSVLLQMLAAAVAGAALTFGIEQGPTPEADAAGHLLAAVAAQAALAANR